MADDVVIIKFEGEFFLDLGRIEGSFDIQMYIADKIRNDFKKNEVSKKDLDELFNYINSSRLLFERVCKKFDPE